MNSNLAQFARQREQLSLELSKVRRHSLLASSRGDFRVVAKLTLEAARLNQAIFDSQDQELLAL
jgi:hypothetical protein